VLSRRAEPTDRAPLSGPELSALAEDLVDTMRASPACVGLAAPQIGVSVRAFVVDVTGHPKARSCHGEFVMFDPRLISVEGAAKAREGCMSVPDLTGDVVRPTSVVVAGRTVAGDELVVATDAFEARAVLHEMDHLDGKLFLDRVSGPSGVFRRKTYR
jgi:peptide deformylase